MPHAFRPTSLFAFLLVCSLACTDSDEPTDGGADGSFDATAPGDGDPADAALDDAATADAGGLDAAAGDAGGLDAATGDAGGLDAATGDAGGLDAATGDAGGLDATTGDGAVADAGDPPLTCRNNAACDPPAQLCFGPEDIYCGVPGQFLCGSDARCSMEVAGRVCHSRLQTCNPYGVGSHCGESCAIQGCDEGFTCLPSGHCRPTVCGQGFECPPSQVCDPTSIDNTAEPGRITHGCVTIACMNDDPCPESTFCVNGYCQTDRGFCSPPPP